MIIAVSRNRAVYKRLDHQKVTVSLITRPTVQTPTHRSCLLLLYCSLPYGRWTGVRELKSKRHEEGWREEWWRRRWSTLFWLLLLMLLCRRVLSKWRGICALLHRRQMSSSTALGDDMLGISRHKPDLSEPAWRGVVWRGGFYVKVWVRHLMQKFHWPIYEITMACANCDNAHGADVGSGANFTRALAFVFPDTANLTIPVSPRNH